MVDTPRDLVSIRGQAGQSLSKAQQKFNRLVNQIAQCRSQLKAWESVLPRCALIHAERVRPLDDEIESLQLRLPCVLAEAHAMKGLPRSLRNQLSEIICDLIAQLPEAMVMPAMKDLYNGHSRTDFDDDKAEDRALMKGMISDLTGVELDDVDDFDGPGDLLEEAVRKFKERQQQDDDPPLRPDGRKKTARQIAREEARAAEEKSVTQSVREVYRKLASALHPDREVDPGERARKTDLMQCANDAYAQGNLLRLLELQWELEQIDPAALAGMPAQRLKHYLLVLKEQLLQIEGELRHTELRAVAQFQLGGYARIDPARLPRLLEEEAVRKAKVVRDMKDELELLKDPAALRAFVRAYRQHARQALEECPF